MSDATNNEVDLSQSRGCQYSSYNHILKNYIKSQQQRVYDERWVEMKRRKSSVTDDCFPTTELSDKRIKRETMKKSPLISTLKKKSAQNFQNKLHTVAEKLKGLRKEGLHEFKNCMNCADKDFEVLVAKLIKL